MACSLAGKIGSQTAILIGSIMLLDSSWDVSFSVISSSLFFGLIFQFAGPGPLNGISTLPKHQAVNLWRNVCVCNKMMPLLIRPIMKHETLYS